MTCSRERSGVLARKLGMTRIFDDQGLHVPVTVLSLDGCRVVGRRSDEDRPVETGKGGSVTRNDGYRAVIMGIGDKKPGRTAKAQRAQFAAAGVEPRAMLAEFRIAADAPFPDNGAGVQADHFAVGQRVDIAGTTIGKGFAGAMKRWNFGGMRASHGVSISHRAHGSTGQCQDPGRVFKGKKMAGHYGGRRVTVQNLEVVRTDCDRGLVLVRGAVPGHRGAFVEIRDAVKKPLHADVPPHGSFRVSADAAGDSVPSGAGGQ